MRVELIYSPGCSSYKKALSVLQTVIAEERLPLHVEVVVKSRGRLKRPSGSPAIHIDGRNLLEADFGAQGEFCPLYSTQQGLAAIPSIEQVRSLLWHKWQELTAAPLLSS